MTLAPVAARTTILAPVPSRGGEAHPVAARELLGTTARPLPPTAMAGLVAATAYAAAGRLARPRLVDVYA